MHCSVARHCWTSTKYTHCDAASSRSFSLHMFCHFAFVRTKLHSDLMTILAPAPQPPAPSPQPPQGTRPFGRMNMPFLLFLTISALRVSAFGFVAPIWFFGAWVSRCRTLGVRAHCGVSQRNMLQLTWTRIDVHIRQGHGDQEGLASAQSRCYQTLSLKKNLSVSPKGPSIIMVYTYRVFWGLVSLWYMGGCQN